MRKSVTPKVSKRHAAILAAAVGGWPNDNPELALRLMDALISVRNWFGYLQEGATRALPVTEQARRAACLERVVIGLHREMDAVTKLSLVVASSQKRRPGAVLVVNLFRRRPRRVRGAVVSAPGSAPADIDADA